MKINIEKYSSKADKADLLVLPMSATEGRNSRKAWAKRFHADSESFLQKLDTKLKGTLGEGIIDLDYQATPGAKTCLPLGRASKNLMLGGVKNYSDAFDSDSWRIFGGQAAKEISRTKAKNINILLCAAPRSIQNKALQSLVEGLMLGSYAYEEYKTKKSDKSSVSVRIFISGEPSSKQKESLKVGKVLAESVCLARDLVNCPPSDMQPKDLAAAARGFARRKNSRLKVKILSKAELKKLGANALLGVSLGSSADPCMIELRYTPSKKTKDSKKIVFVGKGVTYDSGGLSIKTRGGMETMKCDMAGAAAVLGVMEAIDKAPKSLIKHEVIGLIPATENMINGKSIKPGDVLKAINGKTIEVLNTDAEGRLILADALSYSKRYKADYTVDLATLTGACVAAVGDKYAGVFTEDDELAERLLKMGSSTGERLWRLPLNDAYRSLINSPVADIKNTGPGGPGATIAALILREFVPESTRWAHLDIAGPAFVSRGNDYIPKGGTGFGIRALFDFVQEI